MKKLAAFVFIFFGLFTVSVFAQPRPADKNAKDQTTSTTTAPTAAKPNPAPQTISAKYQGGIFGYQQKMDGTLNFDDRNERLIFKNKENKEVMSIPYKSLLVIYPDTKSARSTAGTVISSVPIPYGVGALGSLLRSKSRYLVIQFDDPDSDVKGLTSFKIENKELLQSVIFSLGEKAKMKQRGDAYYRPRTPDSSL